MLPTAAVRRPAAFRIEASIWTVVVLPLVPVTASQGAASRAAQPPGELDVAPDRHAGLGGGREERLVGLPAGGGDDEFGALGQGRAVAEAHGDAQRLQFGGLRAGALVVAVVDDGDERAEAVQDLGGRDAGDAETGDGDALALPVGHLSAAHPA